jgi:hypothetical protein
MPKRNTNLIPAGMTRLQLLEGHLALHERIRDWDNFAARVKGYISGVKWHRQDQLSKEETLRRRRVERLGKFLAALRGRTGDLVLGGLFSIVRNSPRRRGQRLAILLEPKARKAILDIIAHAMEHAPHLFPDRVGPLIVMQFRQRELLKHARPLMLEQIEMESAAGLKLEAAEESFVVAEKFNAPYKALFPDIYKRVQEGLTNKTLVEEALIEIFTEFLSQWGTDWSQVEDYHRTELEALCDAAVATRNRAPLTGFVRVGPLSSDNFKITKLPEEILHCVEQELRLRQRPKEAAIPHAAAF